LPPPAPLSEVDTDVAASLLPRCLRWVLQQKGEEKLAPPAGVLVAPIRPPIFATNSFNSASPSHSRRTFRAYWTLSSRAFSPRMNSGETNFLMSESRYQAESPLFGMFPQLYQLFGESREGEGIVGFSDGDAGSLKRCSTDGTVKDSIIEIEGEHRDPVVSELERRTARNLRSVHCNPHGICYPFIDV
jgi:hypothetical protein